MNVDKFGHNVYKNRRIKHDFNIVDCALKRLNNNILDAQYKIIRNVNLPVYATDSANKEYVDKSIEDFDKKIGMKYTAEKELLYKSIEKYLKVIQTTEHKLSELTIKLNNLENIVNKSKK